MLTGYRHQPRSITSSLRTTSIPMSYLHQITSWTDTIRLLRDDVSRGTSVVTANVPNDTRMDGLCWSHRPLSPTVFTRKTMKSLSPIEFWVLEVDAYSHCTVSPSMWILVALVQKQGCEVFHRISIKRFSAPLSRSSVTYRDQDSCLVWTTLHLQTHSTSCLVADFRSTITRYALTPYSCYRNTFSFD